MGNLTSGVGRLVRFRYLIWGLARQELRLKYKGTWFGAAWSFLQPVLALGVYVLVFSKLMRERAFGDDRDMYVFSVFCGLLPYHFFAEVINASPTLVSDRVQILKGAIFPIEVVPVARVVASAIHMAVGWVACILLMLAYGQMPLASALLLPLALLPLFLGALGLSWALSAGGVFVGDLKQLTGVVVHLMFFLSPVFYSVDTIRPELRPWVLLNPLAHQIEVCRALMLGTGHASIAMWGVQLAAAVVAAVAGLWVFLRHRIRFLDVL